MGSVAIAIFIQCLTFWFNENFHVMFGWWCFFSCFVLFNSNDGSCSGSLNPIRFNFIFPSKQRKRESERCYSIWNHGLTAWKLKILAMSCVFFFFFLWMEDSASVFESKKWNRWNVCLTQTLALIYMAPISMSVSKN